MDRQAGRLLDLLAGASRRGEFVLSSGKKSDFYLNGKLVTLTTEGLDLVARLLLPRVRAHGATAVGGPSPGADPMVGALGVHAFREGVPLSLFFVRKEAKGHGTGQRVEGPPIPDGARVVLIEDVVTSGASLLSAVEAVREAYPCQVVATICLVDREEGGTEALARAGAPLESLFRRRDLEGRLPHP